MGLFTRTPEVETYFGTGTPNIKNRSNPFGEGNITEDEARWMERNWGRCPDCGWKLVGGPEGGGAQNCPCINPDCRSEFTLGYGARCTTRNGKLSPDRRRWFQVPPISLGMSGFARGRHKPNNGYSYFRGGEEELIALVDDHWPSRSPGEGRSDLSKVVVVPIAPVPPDKFVGTTVNINEIPSSIIQTADGPLIVRGELQLEAKITRRQPNEDPFVKVSATSLRMPQSHPDEAYPPFVAVPLEKVNYVQVVCYHKDALLENGGARSTDKDWEIVAITASAVDGEPMHPLTMARNFLQKPGGTFAPYTPEQFAQAIYYWSQRVSVKS
jgi:hypothetical protein